MVSCCAPPAPAVVVVVVLLALGRVGTEPILASEVRAPPPLPVAAARDQRQLAVVKKSTDEAGGGGGGGGEDFEFTSYEGLFGQLFGSPASSISKASSASSVSSTVPCQTDFVDIYGGDINDATRSGQQTRSTRDCQLRCAATLGCAHWAWHRLTGNCWLKRTDGLRFPQPMIVSGPKFCNAALHPEQHAARLHHPPAVAREQCAEVTGGRGGGGGRGGQLKRKNNGPCSASSPYQTITGRCNNLAQPEWGAADIPFLRLVAPVYTDPGTRNAPRRSRLGSELPNTRTVAAAFPEKNNPDTRVTSMMMQFGQFLDHDISATSVPEKRCCATPSRPECFNIYVSANDVTYSLRHNASATCIDFSRSRPACSAGLTGGVGGVSPQQREQVNTITAYIDASNVYGSDEETADVLRTKVGGRLVENDRVAGHLPTKLQLNRLSDHLDDRLDFVAGDSRVNEQPFLTALHVLFLREHNRLAALVAREAGVHDDELLYQSARKLVMVQMQAIAYNEFLPVLLGQRYITKYNLDMSTTSTASNNQGQGGQQSASTTYNPNINPSLYNSFAGAAFRFGHSMINGLFKVIISNKEIFWRLSDLFNGNKFNGNNLLDIEPMIEGLLKQNAQKVDGSFANELTNHLFSEHSPKRHARFGGDLVARNIQRGRDHGLPGYNTFRRVCGLAPIQSFANKPPEIPRAIWRKFQTVYRHVNDIDVYPAGISETPVAPDAMLGPTFSCLIGLQFRNLKFGDRFFFSHGGREEPNYILDLLERVRTRRLSDVICDNTDIAEVQVFAMEAVNNVTNPVKRCVRPGEEQEEKEVNEEETEEELPEVVVTELPSATSVTEASAPVRFTVSDALSAPADEEP